MKISKEGSLLLINKPKNWTSFDVVNKLRHLLKIKKIGHWVEDKHIAIKIIVWLLIIVVFGILLTFMWLFGTAFGEWIMDEWGHQALVE